MRLSLYLFTISLFLPLKSQSQGTFLMYHKSGLAIHRTDANPANRSLFVLSDFVMLKKSTGVRTNLGLNNRYWETEKWRYSQKGSAITVRNKYGRRKGIIVNDSLLTCRECWNDSIEFFLVPIKMGKKTDPFEGQLMWQEGGNGMQNRAIILTRREGESYNLWNLWLSGEDTFINGAQCFFKTEQFNNIIFSDVLAFQVLDSLDSVFSCDVFNTIVFAGDTIRFSRKLLRKSFPSPEAINKVKDLLAGDWSLTKGLVLKDSFKTEPLNATYKFIFRDNVLIVDKKFPSQNFKDQTETFAFSINPSGNLIEYGRNNPIILRDVKQNKISLFLNDSWYTPTNDHKGVRLLLELKRN